MRCSLGSKATLTLVFLVRNTTCQQIFMNSGCTGKCSPLNQASSCRNRSRNRIIFPRKMRPEILEYIHEGHQGKKHCFLRAKNTIFWPRIYLNMQQLVEKCMFCQEHGKYQPLIGTTQEVPPFPWHTLAIDLFYWNSMDFLMVADVFSKYILVRNCPIQHP